MSSSDFDLLILLTRCHMTCCNMFAKYLDGLYIFFFWRGLGLERSADLYYLCMNFAQNTITTIPRYLSQCLISGGENTNALPHKAQSRFVCAADHSTTVRHFQQLLMLLLFRVIMLSQYFDYFCHCL